MYRFLLILLMLSSSVFAQTDTIYYNQHWDLATKEDATYFSFPPVKEGDKYKVTDYYMNGNKQMEGEYASLDPMVEDGYFTYYYENGKRDNYGRYSKGIPVGPWKEMYEDTARVRCLRIYSVDDNDTLVRLTSFYKSGKVKRKEYITKKDDVGVCFDGAGNEIAFTPYELMPKFKKGDLNAFLGQNIQYPLDCRNANIEGQVVLGFAVSKKGDPINIVVLSNPHLSLTKEAIRVVKLMKGWEPGKLDGEAVEVYYTLPVTFRLTD